MATSTGFPRNVRRIAGALMIVPVFALATPRAALSQASGSNVLRTVAPPVPPILDARGVVANALRPHARQGSRPRTYWLEGGLAGLIVVGAMGAGFGYGIADPRQFSAAVYGFVGGGVFIGFPLGALIGGLIPKP